MASKTSVTIWLEQLKDGQPQAADELWQRYFRRLVGLARRMLESSPKRAADEEDVALSAFKSFCIRAEAGSFPRLDDRDGLWKLLMTITVRKALRLKGKQLREQQHNDGDLYDDQLAAAEPDPEEVALLTEEFERLIHSLGDDRLREVALMKLEGYTNKEISESLGRHITYVERKLQLIRRIWSEEQPS